MTSFVNVCDVKSTEKRYACLKIVNNSDPKYWVRVNNKTKMNMTCVSSHRCLGSLVVRKNEFRLKGFITLEEINLSRQKENYLFYLFDKSWYFPAKHVILSFNGSRYVVVRAKLHKADWQCSVAKAVEC